MKKILSCGHVGTLPACWWLFWPIYMKTNKGLVHFNLEILLWQLGFCFLYRAVHSYSQDFSNWVKLASSVSQPLKGPHQRGWGKTSRTTSPRLGSLWEAKFALRDKAFQGAHILRDTQMVPLKTWIGHSSWFHSAFLSEAAFPILQVTRMSKSLVQKTPTQTLTQKEKHTQHSSWIKHIVRHFSFFSDANDWFSALGGKKPSSQRLVSKYQGKPAK